MVNHIDRGWELPGGKITEGESFDITALRELFEEAGVLGTATDYDEKIIPKGIVVRVEIDEEPQPYGWESEDEKITEVGWCVELPGELYWGEEELNRLLNHDWSASSSLSS
jgi:8-oxo-dGTP pyrophosphatase MutT (NUDIX family)